MKKLLTVIVLFSVVALISACSKGNNSPAGLYFMKATIGSYSFDAEGASKAYINWSSSGGIDVITLNGKADDGKVIQIKLTTPTGVNLPLGTVLPIGTSNAQGYYYPLGFDSTYSYGVSGTVLLSAISPNYEGTFSFTCADSTKLTNGTFSIKIP